jgi:hypothetical protein
LNVRKLLLLLFGFSLPHLLLTTLYFLWGETGALWQNFYAPNLTVHGTMLISLKSILVLSALPICYFVFSLFMLNREARFTKYQSQLFQVMFQWMMFCFVQLLVTREFTPHSLIIFIPSIAYFISHYLLLIRRRWIAEGMLWIFFGGILTLNLLARYDRLTDVHYTTLFPPESPYAKDVKDQRVMVLTNDVGIYRQNKLAGYFFDWDLSKDVIGQPDYYENVILIQKAFKTDQPDLIVDPDGLMGKFFERIPGWQSYYKKESIFYRKTGIPATKGSP